ncbi:transcriptional regulator, Sir2 family domain containing protein, putative [Babesia bigemina]|uniref:protein acetyllysine N-acetyltransferase n=1 Tax=Babesia bigemina TaxID=5866 RepID=A0A061D3Y4_BABBI|nr:transcriptional regulator, Sir2 family domain containing protein, putative [Babesia bigemina]CDR95436.1 transcriptional regulator, Sir2 family domain containing protein, putative [Babesia bigemina]|eukprot:XP_012767622.1 transcriptional regulator, Sir2 family domain containing protein, putative [Babesia bigemina]
MASSALNYASQLRRNDNKGPCGGAQLFDTPAEVSRKFKKLSTLLSDSKYTLLHTGAGISTAAGIPDFRGPSGVWTVMSLQNGGEGKRRKMTDGDCTAKNTGDVAVEYGHKKLEPVEFSQAMPSEAHLAILALLRAGHVQAVITQNIDGLHAISGMRFSECSELHGNVFIERCISCGRRFLRPYVAPTISFKPTGNHCGICHFPPCGVLTDVVLDWFDRYEDHFEKRAISYAEEADLHLALGSSLHVEPACHYASSEHYRKEDAPLVIVNYQKTRLHGEADVVLHCDVNKICTRLLKSLNVALPKFLRHFNMVALHYRFGGHNKLLLRFPCIISIFVNDEYASLSGVSHRCIDRVQGLHEFTFTGDFEAILKLWFDAELVLRARFSPDCSFSGLVWQLCLAATDGVLSHRKNTQIAHEFDDAGGEDPISVARLTLSYNAAMIAKSDACRVIAKLCSEDNTIPGFNARAIPESICRLLTCFTWLFTSGDGPFAALAEIKEDVDCLEEFEPIDHLDLLPEAMRVCVRLALQRQLGTVCKNQFCIDIKALNAARNEPYTLDVYFATSEIRLLCSPEHEFGELLDAISGEMRMCLPRKIRPIALCRASSFNPLNELFLTVLRSSMEAVMKRQSTTAADVKLIKAVQTEFPVWVACYISCLFECR